MASKGGSSKQPGKMPKAAPKGMKPGGGKAKGAMAPGYKGKGC